MDSLAQIKAILEAAEGTAQAKQKTNIESKRGETNMGSAPTHQKAVEVLAAPGMGEADKASNATGRATHPMNDSKAKNSSHKGTGLKQENDETNSNEDTIEEGELPAFMKKKGEKDEDGDKDSGGDKMARLRALRGKKNKKGSDDKDGEEEEEKSVKKEDVDVTEHINALFSGDETLTEDFKNKAKTIFEAALADREINLREEISEEYEEAIVESMNTVKAELAEQLDSYLNYVVDQWMAENKLQVENGIKNEISESFLTGLRSLFLEHNIEVPESKVDLVAELSERVAQLEGKLNEEIITNVEMNEKLEEYKKNEIIATVGDDLASTDFDKFAKLTESVSFEDDTTYTKKLGVIKASYFKGSKPVVSASNKALLTEDSMDGSTETTTEETPSNEPLTESMQQYVNVASKIKPRKTS